ncbi:hypothetical protein K490DRAFT_70799 [Saccharata proteae CBS 121410]|uniref:2-oxoisovalerate dehydrogenase subunit alpha n=1 Tax=Saccharata proteae CBS 121410 TaxID=1314787 RepID=A0A9P4M2C3_9PEZI|nr:hypothetical protein K490DRAFT_70799 [Saccharata proteae CBS 121410]
MSFHRSFYKLPARKLPYSLTLRTPCQRLQSSIAQALRSDKALFPGAPDSIFTTSSGFVRPSEKKAMPTYRILDQDGAIVDKSRAPLDIPHEDIITWYKNMVTMSIMDEIMYNAQRQGRISFYITSAGEEGLAIGSAAGLDPRDVIFMQYREAGVFKQRGFTLDDFMNQLFANRHDPGCARNMPVHYGSRKLNIHPISSPLATQIPQASGAAYALKIQALQSPEEKPRVVACYFGEGAASEGDFHAALNIAATRACPVVFICRNNGYAISTKSLEQYRGDGIASRGIGYGIDTVRVDGNDIFAVHEITKAARRMALEDGGKPVLIEAMSYRASHHSTSDDSSAYRAKGEVEDWKRRDNPITRLRKWMEAQTNADGKKLWDEDREKTLRETTRKEVLKAFARAEKEKRPALRNLWVDVYEEVTEEQRSQMEEMRRIVETYEGEYDVSEFEEGIEGFRMK